MNKIFLTRVIEKVKQNNFRCPKCKKKEAEFEIVKSVIMIKNCCCNEYYNSLSEMIQDEINLQSSTL